MTIAASALLAVFGVVGVVAPAAAQDVDCRSHFLGGQAPIVLNPKLAASMTMLCYDGFAAGTSSLTKTGIWSAEHLTAERIEAARKLPRVNSFHADPNLPPGKRAELRDYVGSGYDRGHIAPNGDMPNARSAYQSYSLAQMFPDDPLHNRILWEGVESSTRRISVKLKDSYVVTGTLFLGTDVLRLKAGELVPTHVFKAVYLPLLGKASVYLTRNGPGMDYQVITVAEAERIGQINIYPAMPESRKATLIELPAPTPHRGGAHMGDE